MLLGPDPRGEQPGCRVERGTGDDRATIENTRDGVLAARRGLEKRFTFHYRITDDEDAVAGTHDIRLPPAGSRASGRPGRRRVSAVVRERPATAGRPVIRRSPRWRS
ncbi:hypothetical protein GCM10027445_00160 [Amycolatopsis endophytica]